MSCLRLSRFCVLDLMAMEWSPVPSAETSTDAAMISSDPEL
jgi:hypothetical protein